MKKTIVSVLLALGAWASPAFATTITNGSFELGFTGWTTQDLSSPYYALRVVGAGTGNGFFTTAPTNGNLVAASGFDGNGPGTIKIAQTVTIDNASTINFDYRAGWNNGGSSARLFNFDVFTANGLSLLSTRNILTAAPGTFNNDTGARSASVDLSAFSGQTVQIAFDLLVPQYYTGPAFFQLDNVTSSASTVPDSGASAAMLGLALVGIVSLRRQRVGA